MNWAAATVTGFGLGVAYFGGLWLAVRGLRAGGATRLAVGRTARLGLAGITFYGLLRTGGVTDVAFGLAGLVLARWDLARSIGGSAYGR